MTERLEIYSGPTGELVYDSERGTGTDGYNEVMHQAYDNGVLLYHNSHSGEVHAYFNATRNAPEQFIGKYQSDGQTDDILSTFKSRLEDVIDSMGWTLLAQAGGKQGFYNDLGTVSELQPSRSMDSIADAVSDCDAIDDLKLGVPDRHTAARLVEYIRSTSNSVDMVVTEGYVPSGYEDAYIKIYIGESDSEVVPIKDTKQAIRRNSLRQSITAVQTALENLVSTATADDVGASKEDVVQALKEADIESTGVTSKLQATDDSEDPILTWGVRTALVGSLLAVLAVGYLSLSTFGALLSTVYPVIIPLIGYRLGTYSSWIILAGPTIVVLGVSIWLFLKWAVENLPARDVEPFPPDLLNEARNVVDRLRSLEQEPLIESEAAFKDRADEAFEPYDFVYLELARSEQRKTIIQLVIGVGAGMLFATGVAGTLWYGRSILFDHWITVVKAVYLLTLVLLFVAVLFGTIWFGRKAVKVLYRVAQKNRSKTQSSPQKKREVQPMRTQSSGNRLIVVLLLLIIVILITISVYLFVDFSSTIPNFSSAI
jgi:hypothetical protein